jgi:hypothetical protein
MTATRPSGFSPVDLSGFTMSRLDSAAAVALVGVKSFCDRITDWSESLREFGFYARASNA